MGFIFGSKSREKLDTLHHELRLVMYESIKVSEIDFGIAEGYRNVKTQQEYYAKGRTAPGDILTYIDGVNKKSKHNYKPSLAVDIYAYIDGKANYDKDKLSYLAGIIQGTANRLLLDGLVNNKIKWGGHWTKFVDMPHFELSVE